MNTQGMIPLKENDSKKISDRYQKKTYAKGATCIYGDTLYRAKADITTAEEWTAAHWEETNMETIRAEMAAEVSSLNANSARMYNIAYNTVTSVYNQDFEITSLTLKAGYKYLLLSSSTISISSSTVMMHQFSITSGKATINASTARTTGTYGGGCVNFAEVETDSGDCTIAVIGHGVDSTPHTQSALLLAIKLQAI